MELGKSGDLAARELRRRAIELEENAKKLRQLADDVRRAGTIDQLRRLGDLDQEEQLLQGALLIAKLDHPDLDVDAYRARIDEMSEEIQALLPEQNTATQRREAMHRYLFQQNGFHGSRSEYYHAANSHLNRVIDDREGLPITMSILYMELGRRLELRIEGVGLPGHFVANHVISDSENQLVDVFERGQLLAREDAERIVAMHAGRALRNSDLRASTDIEILTRVLNNLIGIAGRKNDGESMLRYCDAMVAINPEETRFRLMRAQLRGMTGRIKLALEDVDSLLEDDSAPIDRQMTERLREALIDRQ